jgi:hypothetical protein
VSDVTTSYYDDRFGRPILHTAAGDDRFHRIAWEGEGGVDEHVEVSGGPRGPGVVVLDLQLRECTAIVNLTVQQVRTLATALQKVADHVDEEAADNRWVGRKRA